MTTKNDATIKLQSFGGGNKQFSRQKKSLGVETTDSQQHGTNETRNTYLNTNLMQGHRDSSVSPCSLPEITEYRIFYILFYCEQISLKGIIFCT